MNGDNPMDNVRARERTIYKYPLGSSAPFGHSVSAQTPFTLNMPAGAIVLTVQEQNGEACVWALVNPNNDIQPREFYLAGTARACDAVDGATYIDTFQLQSGELVWHLFELAP